MNIVQAMGDKKLFAPWFKDPVSWAAWIALLAAMSGLPMTEAQLAVYRACTGRQEPPAGGVNEMWLVIGRRGGKSLILALIAIYTALFRDWRPHLVPGERGTVLVLATDRRQAQSIMRYARAMVEEVPLLAAKIERIAAEEIEFTNGTAVEIATASYRTVRGRTLIAALLDEIAFWRSEDSANPDIEVLDAIRPAMASVPGAMLWCASSPYARRGVLHDAYRRWYGQENAPCLVWQADTRTMNPSISQTFIDGQYERDPESASAEYGAEFRNDISAFIGREVVDACVESGCHERPYVTGAGTYFGFVDAAGGAGSDSMTLGIAHRTKERDAVLDVIREIKPPFSPEAVVAEFAALIKTYKIYRVESDKWGGDWVGEAFRKHNIRVVPCAKPKSDIYREALPLLSAHKCQLLDNNRLIAQMCGLERRTARGGRDSIDHAPGAHDDLVNSACGALVMAAAAAGPVIISEEARAWAAQPGPHTLGYSGRRSVWL